MTELTPVIQKIKERVSEEVWRERILNCQNSGLPISEWCRKNNIAPVTYYRLQAENFVNLCLGGFSFLRYWTGIVGYLAVQLNTAKGLSPQVHLDASVGIVFF